MKYLLINCSQYINSARQYSPEKNPKSEIFHNIFEAYTSFYDLIYLFICLSLRVERLSRGLASTVN